jgi:putative endonuclease
MNEIHDNHVTGAAGEELAALYLEHEGMDILETNFRFGRGEIDLIAREGDTLVFCEVKYRRTDEFGPPEYAVTPHKQRQLRRLAEGYLALRRITDQECRFDVVAIRRENGLPRLHHLRNAF